ncbi:MAG: hypothetical protein RIC55_28130 [Pirellulaceae bacterium]
MDARLYLLTTIYEVLRPLNLWDEYGKPGWSDRQFMRDCVLRFKRGEHAAWNDFLVQLESDRPLAIVILCLLADHRILLSIAKEEGVEADPITAIDGFMDQAKRGPDISEMEFNLPDAVASFTQEDERHLRAAFDTRVAPQTPTNYSPQDAKRFLPPASRSTGDIMYIEKKPGLAGPARIGRVRFSKTRKTIYYNGKKLQSLKGSGYKANYYDVESGMHYWISKCRQDGADTLYPGEVEIDDNVREEYWTEIRQQPEHKDKSSFRSPGKYSKRRPC